MSFGFEKLRVWQLAISLSTQVRGLTQTFPSSERYNLTSQFNRAIDSVSLNIAEGSGGTNPEFKNFLRIAYRSTLECVNCIYIAKNERFINEEQFDEFYNSFVSLTKQIQALRNSIK